MAIARGIVIIGMGKVLQNIKASEARLKRAAEDALKEAGKDIIAEAQENTPHDTGNLKGSAFVESKPRKTPLGLEQRIGYAAAYSLFVHEIDKNYRRGGWKFLENALVMHEGLALRLFAKRLRKAL